MKQKKQKNEKKELTEVIADKSKKLKPVPNKSKDVKSSTDEKLIEKVAPSPSDIKMQHVNSAIDDCNAIVKIYITHGKTNILTVPETCELFNAYFELASLFNTYGKNKMEALAYITQAINVGSGKINITFITKAMLFRSRIKIGIAQSIKG